MHLYLFSVNDIYFVTFSENFERIVTGEDNSINLKLHLLRGLMTLKIGKNLKEDHFHYLTS